MLSVAFNSIKESLECSKNERNGEEEELVVLRDDAASTKKKIINQGLKKHLFKYEMFFVCLNAMKKKIQWAGYSATDSIFMGYN